MTTQERFNEIKENLLWMSNNLRLSMQCAYFDPYYPDLSRTDFQPSKVRFGFGCRTMEALDAEIMKYAEEHPAL